MTIAIVGAGAIGGLLGARLARSGQEVVLFARGAHLEALRRNGVTVLGEGAQFTEHPACSDDMTAVSSAEVVFITLKSHSLAGVAETIGRSLKSGAYVVSAMNGIPWWYLPDRHLESVDPGGVIARSIPRERVIGSIVYPAATIVEPGVIRHEEGDRISVGEPDGSRTDRVLALSRVLTAAGFKAPVQTRFAEEMWLKLAGNATLNPVSAITRTTLGVMLGSPAGWRLVHSLMEEVEAVAHSLGLKLPLSIDKRMAGAARLGDHKTSTLQDLEAGKPLELDALVGAVIEIADWKGVEVPRLKAVYDLAKLTEAARLR